MKFAKLFFTAAVAVASTSAQVSNVEVAMNRLQKLSPEVKWDRKSAVIADVTCDGKPDVVILGFERDKVLVGVVPGGQQNQIQEFSFPVSGGTQGGFCSLPSRLEISPLNCQSEEGPLPGCMPVKACRAFAIIDDGCDPFNFYWDSSRKTLAWWRN